ncbi:hypothetical protein AAE478_010324 [Parahypoxylon ruwenzoriense]
MTLAMKRNSMKEDDDYALSKSFEKFKIPEQDALANLRAAHYATEDALKNVSLRESMQHMTQIFQSLDASFRVHATAPTTAVSLDEYLTHLKLCGWFGVGGSWRGREGYNQVDGLAVGDRTAKGRAVDWPAANERYRRRTYGVVGDGLGGMGRCGHEIQVPIQYVLPSQDVLEAIRIYGDAQDTGLVWVVRPLTDRVVLTFWIHGIVDDYHDNAGKDDDDDNDDDRSKPQREQGAPFVDLADVKQSLEEIKLATLSFLDEQRKRDDHMASVLDNEVADLF